MLTTILKTPDLTFKQRVFTTQIKWSFFLLVLSPVCIAVSFYCNAIGVMVFSMGVFMLGAVTLVSKLYVFVNYIYEIEYDADKQEIILKNSKRLFRHTLKTYTLKIDNFKLRYFSGFRVDPGFWIEQKHPYLDVVKQYNIGYWKENNSVELFRQFTTQFGPM